MTEAIGAQAFCWSCGQKHPTGLPQCPHCGAPVLQAPPAENLSPKSFGLAVALCGIFGTAGIHHFYLGNILHGLFDLSLFILTVGLYLAGIVSGLDGLLLAALLVFLVDALHTGIVFYRLIVGRQRDGRGRLVTLEGARR